jgi:hypothetical protein
LLFRVDDNGVVVAVVAVVVAALEEEVDILYTEEWVVENDTTRMSALSQKEKRQRKSNYSKKDKWHQIITGTKSLQLQQYIRTYNPTATTEGRLQRPCRFGLAMERCRRLDQFGMTEVLYRWEEDINISLDDSILCLNVTNIYLPLTYAHTHRFVSYGSFT